MHETYSDLVTISKWPALATKIPAANLSAATEDEPCDTTSPPRKNRNGTKCHICGSEYHLRANCPERKNNSDYDDDSKNSNGGDSNWRYITPTDENSIIEVNGVKYYYCKSCKCKRTGKVGFYNRTHTSTKTPHSEDHKFPVDREALLLLHLDVRLAPLLRPSLS